MKATHASSASRTGQALPSDPLLGMSLLDFGRELRGGRITSEEITQGYLARIAVLGEGLKAFEYLAADSALETARSIDRLLAAGVDLGPLMGIPIAVKDLFVVSGMPTTAGSAVDVSHLLTGEGSFVRKLRQAGCVILGKTKTTEFAFSGLGVNSVRGTPRNPWDSQVVRTPGGSSSGSAVAVAAGLCAFALGSDTGGSVRLPAALCGIFGLKTTVGLWATDGVFPLAPTFDSIGLLTRSAADAAVAFTAINGEPDIHPARLECLRLAKPTEYLLEGLDPQVEHAYDAMLEQLAVRGAVILDGEMRGVREREGIFPLVLASELLASLGLDRFEAERAKMDPLVAARIARGTNISAHDYLRTIQRHEQLKQLAAADLEGRDAWVTPTTSQVAPALADFADPDSGMRLALAITRGTQAMNLFGQCGTTTPIQGTGASLPVGLQVTCRTGEERQALAIALALENLVGLPRLPDLSGFIQ